MKIVGQDPAEGSQERDHAGDCGRTAENNKHWRRSTPSTIERCPEHGMIGTTRNCCTGVPSVYVIDPPAPPLPATLTWGDAVYQLRQEVVRKMSATFVRVRILAKPRDVECAGECVSEAHQNLLEYLQRLNPNRYQPASEATPEPVKE